MVNGWGGVGNAGVMRIALGIGVLGSVGVAAVLAVGCGSSESGGASGSSGSVQCGPGTLEQGGLCVPSGAAGAAAAGAGGVGGAGAAGKSGGAGKSGAGGSGGGGKGGSGTGGSAAGGNSGGAAGQGGGTLTETPCSYPMYEWNGTAVSPKSKPTPGACVGNVAVVCDVWSKPGAFLKEIECAIGETCRTYEVEAAAVPTTGGNAVVVDSFTWAACIPTDADPATFVRGANGTWASEAGSVCDASGKARVFPVAYPSPQPVLSAPGKVDDLPAMQAGTSKGYLSSAPCGADQVCAMTGTTKPSAKCVGATAKPCTAARCDGDQLVTCQDGYEDYSWNCAKDGMICHNTAATCDARPEHRASCQPPGVAECDPASFGPGTCSADKLAVDSCDSDHCVARHDACGKGEVCSSPLSGSASCVPSALACDPKTFVDRCDGTKLTVCDQQGILRTHECASAGLVCGTSSDPDKPGGVVAGCLVDGGASCTQWDTPPICAEKNTAEYCCDGVFGPWFSYPPSVNPPCLPGRVTRAVCSSCTPHTNVGFTMLDCPP